MLLALATSIAGSPYAASYAAAFLLYPGPTTAITWIAFKFVRYAVSTACSCVSTTYVLVTGNCEKESREEWKPVQEQKKSWTL